MSQGNNTPFGFRPCRHLGGGTPGRNREYPILTGYSTAIGAGDAVKLLSDGTIAAAAAGDRVLGVFVGVQYTDANGAAVFTNRWPASTAATNIKAAVITDPMESFEVQFNKATAPDQTDIGQLADLVTGTPSTVTGSSTAYLSGTTSTAAAQFRIVGLINKPGNDGIYASVEVQIHEHEFSTAVAGTPGV